MSDKKSIDELIEKLKSKNWKEKNQAAEDLAEIGDEAKDRLLQVLLDPNSGASYGAGMALGMIDAPDIAPKLIEACGHENSDVRKAAISTLGKIGGTQATETIVEALRTDEDVSVKTAACDALGKLKDPSTVQALCEALTPSYHKWVYPLAGAALSSIGEVSIPCLIDVIKNPDLRDDAREAASNALVAIGNAAMPELIGIVEDDEVPWFAAPLAVTVIGQIGGQDSVPALKYALQTGNPEVVEVAADALSRLSDPSVTNVLIESLRSDDPTIRGLVAYSVAYSQSADIERELIVLLDDDQLIWQNPQMKEVTVAEAAVSSLEIIGTKEALNAVAEWRKRLEK
jgi:HEAT repeat protein